MYLFHLNIFGSSSNYILMPSIIKPLRSRLDVLLAPIRQPFSAQGFNVEPTRVRLQRYWIQVACADGPGVGVEEQD
jgi:hypothetical protein